MFLQNIMSQEDDALILGKQTSIFLIYQNGRHRVLQRNSFYIEQNENTALN